MGHSSQFKQQWEQCASNFPEIKKQYSLSQKKEREKLLASLMLRLRKCQDELNTTNDVEQLNTQLFSEIKTFFSKGLDYADEQLDVIFSDEMVDATCRFIQAAHFYDPQISFHDVFQACRNVWIMNGLQFLFGVPVKITRSVFAYSMLYPYTDNYIDDRSISSFEKYEFSLRFADRLAGKKVQPRNGAEHKIYEMVELIEEEWERDLYPQVYKSLLAIHKTQTESASLIDPKDELGPDDAFHICIEKGGASVVADGCLVKGALTVSENRFLYAYGAYLQLLDDLQDVDEDWHDGLNTWHVLQAKAHKMEFALNKTWHAGQFMICMVDELGAESGTLFKRLMGKSIDLFLLEAITSNPKCFSKEYTMLFEKHSPFTFSFIRKRSGSFTPFQDRFFDQVERLAMTGGPKEMSFLKKKKPAEMIQQAD